MQNDGLKNPFIGNERRCIQLRFEPPPKVPHFQEMLHEAALVCMVISFGCRCPVESEVRLLSVRLIFLQRVQQPHESFRLWRGEGAYREGKQPFPIHCKVRICHSSEPFVTTLPFNSTSTAFHLSARFQSTSFF